MIDLKTFVGKHVVVGLRGPWIATESKQGTEEADLMLVKVSPEHSQHVPMPCLRGEVVELLGGHGVAFDDRYGAKVVVFVDPEAIATVTMVAQKSPAPGLIQRAS